MRGKPGLLVSSAVALLTAIPAYAQEAPDQAALGREFNTKLADAGAKWGIAVVRATVQSIPEARYVAAPDSLAANAIEQTVAQYNRDKARIQGNITLGEGAVNLAADTVTAGVVLGTAGSGAVPALMVRAAVQAASDDYFSSVRSDATQSLQAFLARNQNRILQDARLSYDQLAELSPDEIKIRLTAGGRTFQELDRKVKDPALKTMARELLVETIVNTQKATLDRIADQNTQINALTGRIGRVENLHRQLVDQTNRVLQQQTDSIAAIDGAVARLNQSVSAVDARLATQERNMEVVQDFMFARMSAGEKAAALRQGGMAGRLACPDGGNGCDQAKLRQALIERFDAEANVQQAIATAGKVVSNAAGLVQIAQDLGIPVSSGTARAVQYGVAAVNAFASVASGNYVGAVMSITGAFAKKGPDPQMKYLAAQFGIINQKLDSILANQKRLSDQITALSKSLDTHMDKVHQRFDKVEFQLALTRALTASAHNQAWQHCQTLYTASQDPAKQASYRYDPVTTSFASVEDASRFAQDHRISADGCSAVITQRLGSFAAADWFGNFLSTATQPSVTDDMLKRVHANRDDSWAVVRAYLANQGIEPWQAFRVYANPSDRLADVRQRIAGRPAGDPCSMQGPLAEDRLRIMLCETTPARPPSASGAAETILKASMTSDHAIDVADWTMLERNLVDLQMIRPAGGPVTARELISASTTGPISHGEEHTRQALLTLDAAMANASLLTGELTIEAVLEALRAPRSANAQQESNRQAMLARVRRMLTDQPALARNVALALLKDRYGLYNNGTRTGVAPLAAAYATALRFARESTDGDPFTVFDTLFGNGLHYRRLPDGHVDVVLMAGDKDVDSVVAPMPEPLIFAEGRLFYGKAVEELALVRQRTGERLLEYGALRRLEPDARRALVATLVRLESLQP